MKGQRGSGTRVGVDHQARSGNGLGVADCRMEQQGCYPSSDLQRRAFLHKKRQHQACAGMSVLPFRSSTKLMAKTGEELHEEPMKPKGQIKAPLQRGFWFQICSEPVASWDHAIGINRMNDT